MTHNIVHSWCFPPATCLIMHYVGTDAHTGRLVMWISVTMTEMSVVSASQFFV